MDFTHLLPFLSTGITVLFTGTVFTRYFNRHRPRHLLLWGMGLALYGLGTFAEAYLAVSWSEWMLRLWYIAGAMLTAAWLGQGTVYLLIRKAAIAHTLTAVLLILSFISVVAIFAAPMDAAAFRLTVPISTQYKEIMTRNTLIIWLTIVLNIYGSIVLIGGAAWSAYLFWRKQVLPYRVIGNIVIAVGAFFPASAGTLIKLGLVDWLYLSELLGATLMFVGFWLATHAQTAERPTLVSATA